MNNKKKKQYPGAQFGSSMMLVVFMVLCLTAFATLSLSSALRDYKYSKRAAEKNTAFYKADAEANRKLADITTLLETTYSESPEEYSANALENLKTISGVTTDMSGSISYDIPVTKQQLLRVELLLNDIVSEDHDFYRITAWKEVPASQWENESTLPVILGD